MKKQDFPKEFVTHPSVFAVENEYQIFVPVRSELLMWIEIGKESFYDHSNGVLRSDTPLHKMCVPMELLDTEKEYTVCYRKVIKRKAYFTETKDVVKVTYKFNPIEKGKAINIYHIADSHSRVKAAVDAALANEKKIDLLILNGDVAEDSSTIERIIGIYEISGNITKGEIPCVYSRGNHDMRGICSDRLAEFAPNRYGRTYYTFRLGDLWGMVLDCGEDKNDDQEEYGNTICCHAFRLEETRFIKETIAKGEFLDNTIKYRMVVCHIPFTRINYNGEGKFNIESELYSEWCRIIGEGVKPDLYLCGHVHVCTVVMPGDPMDNRGQTCPVIVGTRPCTFDEKEGFTGTALILDNDKITVKFTDNVGNEEEIKIK